MDSASIVQGVQALSSSLILYKGIKELAKDIQNSLDKGKSPDTNWCVYFNPLERFKISWPSQRWAMREIGPVLPSLSYVNVPLQLRFRLNLEPTRIPNLIDPSLALFHNLIITVDLHGGIEMPAYVKTVIENISKTFEVEGAKFYDEKSAHRIEDDHATIAGRVVYSSRLPTTNVSESATDSSSSNGKSNLAQEQSLWKFIRIIRFRERMYSLVGTIVESAGMDEIAIKDLFGIMNTFAIIN
jgi:hypothetical protein